MRRRALDRRFGSGREHPKRLIRGLLFTALITNAPCVPISAGAQKLFRFTEHVNSGERTAPHAACARATERDGRESEISRIPVDNSLERPRQSERECEARELIRFRGQQS